MWADLSEPWQRCLDEAWDAYRTGSLPIGVVIVDAAGHVVSRGRNRIFHQTPEGRYLFGHRLAHAEVNALLALDHAAVDARTCTLYTTTEPCPLCIGAIRMARIRTIHYAARDAAAGSTDLLAASPYMRRGAITAHSPERGDLEDVIVAMHVEFGLHVYDESWAWVVDAWNRDAPRGVALGCALFASGELRDLRAANEPTATMIDTLVARLATLSR